MIDHTPSSDVQQNSKLVAIMNTMFILGADEDQNVGTSFVRHLASSGVDVYSCIAGACGALYGIKNGGASQAVTKMLREDIGELKNIPTFLESVKKGKKLLFGFGHRVFKKGSDPRTAILKKLALEAFGLLGQNSYDELAFALEEAASKDEYCTTRGLQPNGNFFTGIIY